MYSLLVFMNILTLPKELFPKCICILNFSSNLAAVLLQGRWRRFGTSGFLCQVCCWKQKCQLFVICCDGVALLCGELRGQEIHQQFCRLLQGIVSLLCMEAWSVPSQSGEESFTGRSVTVHKPWCHLGNPAHLPECHTRALGFTQLYKSTPGAFNLMILSRWRQHLCWRVKWKIKCLHVLYKTYFLIN